MEEPHMSDWRLDPETGKRLIESACPRSVQYDFWVRMAREHKSERMRALIGQRLLEIANAWESHDGKTLGMGEKFPMGIVPAGETLIDVMEEG